MKKVLISLFTDINGNFSCRLTFGSIGFLVCLVAMFIPAVDVADIAIMAPLCAALMGLSALENVKLKKNESEE